MTSKHISKKSIARLKGRKEKETISITTRRGRNLKEYQKEEKS